MNYQFLWDNMIISSIEEVEQAAQLILKGKDIYEEIVKDTKVPWWFIGVTHYRESTCKFNRHPHNGDPLSKKTTHVPAGRPIKGNPPFTFIESAKDLYFSLKKYDTYEDWDIPSILYRLEAFNGMGYSKRNIPSPYLWNKTNHYKIGKYSSDGVYDPNLVDKQVGTAPLVRMLTDKTLRLV
jgi:lysozyme family protein